MTAGPTGSLRMPSGRLRSSLAPRPDWIWSYSMTIFMVVPFLDATVSFRISGCAIA